MPKVDLGLVKGRTGEDGATGATGAPGANGKGYNPRGEWIAGTYYNNTADTVDVVYYQGSSYYCKSSGSGQTPPPDDSANWGLVVSGVSRMVFECTIDPLDWTTTGSTPFAYIAIKQFPHGFLDANGIYNLAMDNVIKEEYGVIVSEVSVSGGVGNDSITFRAKELYQSDLPVKVYTDNVEEVVINGN